MPEPIKTTVEVDGTTHEVEVPVPEGYLSPEEIRENFVSADSIERRIAAAKRGLVDPNAAIADDSFLDRLVAERKDRIIEMLGVKLEGNEPDLEGLREKWREAELAPLRSDLESRDKTISRLREKGFRASVFEAATEAGIREDLYDVVPLWLRDRVRYDEEFDDFFAIDGRGEFEYTAEPAKGKPPYKTISELLHDVERGGEKAAWFKPTGRGGAGYRGGDKKRGRGLTVDEFDKLSSDDQRKVYDESPALYNELTDALAKRNSEKFFAGR